MTENTTGLEIAVIGMAGRFPGARNIHEFWENLENGVESISFFSQTELEEAGVEPDTFDHPNYVRANGILDGIENFDSRFFGYTPGEADIMDPQQRIFHECAWAALEDAGYFPETYEGLIGVYAGASDNFAWGVRAHLSGRAGALGEFAAFQMISKDFLSVRVSYKLNLKGPAVVVQTACSTSLTAVHMACQAILNGECDMALAGGASVSLLKKDGYIYQEGMIVAPDGHCRTFDERAKGTVTGNGVAAVLLKRLDEAVKDGDFIYAVVKGSAINNDGFRKIGFTAPSIEGQAEVIMTAQEMAEVEPESITYVETHGTATELGDPVEIKALKMAFAAGENTPLKKNYCALGSVKSNMGHLDAAAGITGFIKTVLSLYHRQIPPSLHFEKPNPGIDFENSPFYINTRLTPWKNDNYPLRAGVSSFGIGGTNAHAVLEEWPDGRASNAERRAQGAGRKYHLLLLSAKTETALEKMTANLVDYLKGKIGLISPEGPIDIHTVAYTLQVGRGAFKHRKTTVCANTAEAVENLSNATSANVYTFSRTNEEQSPVVIFMFPGQGAQYEDMALELYRTEPVFREETDRCLKILAPLMEDDLKEILYPNLGTSPAGSPHRGVNHTEYAQPLIFAVEYALAKLLMHWGITPYATIGHSIGEYVSACLAGVFSLEDALTLVAVRGRLMQTMPGGAMLSVPLSEKELMPLLDGREHISLAAVNSTSRCVVSGPHEAVDAFARELKEKGCESRRLHTSHAYHSRMMEPVLAEFERRAAGVAFEEKADIPYISNVTGTWARPGETASPRYWAGHIRNTVRFGDGIGELLDIDNAVFLEVGPGRSLSTFVRQHEKKKTGQAVIDLIRHPDENVPDSRYLLNKIGQIWGHGIAVDWDRFHHGEKPARVPLPTYPFDELHYPIEDLPLKVGAVPTGAAQPTRLPRSSRASETAKKQDISRWFHVPSWIPAPITGDPAPREQGGRYLVFINETGPVSRLVDRWKRSGRELTVVGIGTGFARPGEGRRGYTVNPARGGDYRALFEDLKARREIPSKIVHCWNVDEEKNAGEGVLGLDALDKTQDLGFYSLVHIARAIGEQSIATGDGGGIEIIVLTDRMQAVTAGEIPEPQKAPIRGALQVIPVEYPGIRCRGIDIRLTGKSAESSEHLAELLETEIEKTVDTIHPYTAYRDDRRWVPTYRQTPLEKPAGEPAVLKEKGVYLVTGGLGGIGLVLAEYLAKSVNARLILTGRSLFPPREEWDRHAAGTDRETARKIRKIREMEAAGAEVLILPADAADISRMREVARRAEERFGPVNGIIHSAGLPDGGLILTRTREAADAVLAPKIKGTLILDALFNNREKREHLDFFVLCSSLNSVLSPMGQVAYCAANAFLDTYAHGSTARTGTYTVSINWDTWREVGMAVNAVEQLTASYTGTSAGAGAREADIGHPLFHSSAADSPHRRVFMSTLRPDRDWVLDEHRFMGTAVLPGTAYLEIARAAVDIHRNGTGAPLELHDVYFHTPLIVNQNEEKEVRTIVEEENGRYTFTVGSRAAAGEDQWTEHARGKALPLSYTDSRGYDTREIEAGFPGEEILHDPHHWNGTLGTLGVRPTGSAPVFGPRWNCLRRVKAGEDRAFAYLELPGEFSRDLDSYKLHPALLDVAAGLLRIFQNHEDSYFPFHYKRIRMNRPLPRGVFCLARAARSADGPSRDELLTYDITVMDEQGEEVVEIEGYSLKKIQTARHREETAAPAVSLHDPLEYGLLSDEGVDVFKRILARGEWPQVLVSTIDLPSRIEESRNSTGLLRSGQPEEEDYTGPQHPRPQLSTPYVAPATETERRLTRIWRQFLGIRQVGTRDDFFELGGDSLKIMTIASKIHKALDVEIPIPEFFNRPTIEKLAQYIDASEKHEYSPIEPVEVKEYYPLSPTQKRLYLLQQLDKEDVLYNIAVVVTLEGELHRETLEDTFRSLIARHESFRTSFHIVHGETVQAIRRDVEFRVEYFDAQKAEDGDRQIILRFIRPFDLARAPLMRAALIKKQENTHILVVDTHHIISDGVSQAVFSREFMAFYGGKELPPLRIQYKDYSHWRNSRAGREESKKQEEYWLEQFKGGVAVTDLPTDFPRPDVQTFDGAVFKTALSSEMSAALKTIAVEEETSVFNVLTALFTVLLSRLTGRHDISVGTQTAGRRHTELQGILGVFLNTLVLRNYPRPDRSFADFLQETRTRIPEAFENQDYPFENLVEKVMGKRDINRNPMFDVMFLWQNFEAGEIRIPSLALKTYPHPVKNRALIDITIYGQEEGDTFTFSFEYNTGLFRESTILRFIDYFKEIAAAVITDREIRLKDIAISLDLGMAKVDVFKENDDEFEF